MVQVLFDRLLPRTRHEEVIEQSLDALLARYGFDRLQHEQIRADLRAGRIGLAQNRLPPNSDIRDVGPDDIIDATEALPSSLRDVGMRALQDGAVAVVTLAGGQ